MRSMLMALALVLPQLASAEGITNGQYEIVFPVSNDNILSQIVTVTNYTVVTPGSDLSLSVMRFDIQITKKGSFNRSDSYRQLVPGIVWGGKFNFVIASEYVTHVSAYWFEAPNADKNGVFEGTADVPDPDGGRMKKKYWMKRITSNNGADPGVIRVATNDNQPTR
jgi:hypothetical protein